MQKYDFLKYDISALSLSGSDFAIEMSVRGAALKRSGFVGYLFTLGDNNFTYDANDLGFGLSGGQILSVTKPSSYQYGLLYLPGTLDANTFYKVIIKINTIENKSQVCIDNNCGNETLINGFSSSKFSNITSLFIASASNMTYQWNDIIDYVKIYRR